jgi:hypothetical protein
MLLYFCIYYYECIHNFNCTQKKVDFMTQDSLKKLVNYYVKKGFKIPIIKQFSE